MSDFTKDDDTAGATLLSQFEVVKDHISELSAQLEEVERALGKPKPDIGQIKQMVNSAMVIIGAMKTWCP